MELDDVAVMNQREEWNAGALPLEDLHARNSRHGPLSGTPWYNRIQRFVQNVPGGAYEIVPPA